MPLMSLFLICSMSFCSVLLLLLKRPPEFELNTAGASPAEIGLS